MRYAGFWPRLGAALVDMVVLLPIIGGSFWAATESKTTQLVLELPLATAFAVYSIYFIRRWGQTIGKMALKIRVVSLDGAPAGFRRAFYRHVVDLAFSLASSMLTIYGLLSVADDEYAALGFVERMELLNTVTGDLPDIVLWLSFAWTASELVVLLLNEKRRALHDFIAGTVVIHTSEVAAATGDQR